MVKIRVTGTREQDSETLWATPVGGNLYRLENSPFFAYGVSWMDTIEAKKEESGGLKFVRPVRKSGNRTLRAVLEDHKLSDPSGEAILSGLRELGCSYEGMQPRLLSINV